MVHIHVAVGPRYMRRSTNLPTPSLSMSYIYVDVDTSHRQSRQKLQICGLYFQEEILMREDLQASPALASLAQPPHVSTHVKTFHPIFKIPIGPSARIVQAYTAVEGFIVLTWIALRLHSTPHIIIATSGDEKDASNTRCSFWKREINRTQSSRSIYEKWGLFIIVDFSLLVLLGQDTSRVSSSA
jgi:hypothetical protein